MKKGNKERKKERKKHIGPIFLIYMLLLLAAMFLFLEHVKRVLTVYEASQPDHAINALAESLSANGIGTAATVLLPDVADDAPDTALPYTVSVSGDFPCTEFEDPDDYLSQLNAEIRQNGVQYHREREDFSSGAIHYSLYSGAHRFAETSLLPAESRNALRLLTITQWIPQRIRLLREDAAYILRLTVPLTDTVLVNGIAAGGEYVTGSDTIPGLEYCRRYTEIPDLAVYEINGLYRLPEITVTAADGSVAAQYSPGEENSADSIFHMEDHCLTAVLRPQETEMPSELQKTVLDAVETYSLFFSADLAGARNSIEPIRCLFPQDSEYLSLAEEYRRNSMGYFDAHGNTHFIAEETAHYIEYSADCFCCYVYLEKSMTIHGSREVIDKTEGTYYFIKQDDRWVIADIQ